MIGRGLGSRATRVVGSVGTPMLYSLGALALGVLVPRMEARWLPGLSGEITVSAALSLLSAIASGMLPLTGLVFSLAFVMVQFSSTAYSPRLVGWLTGSNLMLHSLGIYTATFVYSLAAIVWVDRGGTGHVPMLTVGLAIVLLMASVVSFVMLIERLGMLQISRVLAYAGDHGRAVIARDYSLLDQGACTAPELQEALSPVTQVVTHRGGPASVQALDIPGLVELAARENAVVVAAWAVGDTVVEGMPLLRVHGGKGDIPERRLRRLMHLGPERTFEQDPKYAIRLLVDIAIRALSPAINDPTTAVQALDQIEDLLHRLGQRSLAPGRIRDSAGRLRLVVPVPRWEDLLILALDEIRYCGLTSIQVMRRMRALLHDLAEHVPEQRRPALLLHLKRLDAGIRRTFVDEDDAKDALVRDRQGLGISREDSA